MYHGDEKKAIPESNRSRSAYFTGLAEKYHVAKYVMLAVLVLMVLFTSVFGSSELKPENFRYFFKYFQINPFSSSASYSDITFTGNSDMKFSMYKGDLVSLCDGMMTIYSISGKVQLPAEAGDADTIESDGKYLALYRRGGNTATLYNSFSDVHTINCDYPITDIDVSSDGGFAVVASGKDSRSSVLVYSKAFSLVYTWKSADKYVSCAELSDNGRYIAVFACGTENGIPFSELTVKKTGSDASVISEKYRGESPYYVFFAGDGGIVSVTDKAARFYSQSGEKRGEKIFGKTLFDVCFSDGEAVFALADAGYSGADIIIFSDKGEEKESFRIDERIYAIRSGEGITVFLGYGKIYVKGLYEGESEISGGALDMFVLDKNNVLLCYTYGTELAEISSAGNGGKDG